MARSVSGPASAGSAVPDGSAAHPDQDHARPARPPWWRPGRRLAWPAGFAVAAVVLFFAYLRLSNTYPENSDEANLGLQAWDMLHGNLLLHGWMLSDVSFFTTELPQYMLLELVGGLNNGTFHLAAAMTYTLALLLVAVLARGRADGRQGLAQVLIAGGIMLAPQLGVGVFILLLTVGHFGTSVPLLVTMLVLDRDQPHWYVPVLAGLLLAWASIADTLVLPVGVAPLAVVALARAAGALIAHRGWRPVSYQLSLVAAAGAAAGIWAGSGPIIRALGGFAVARVPFHVIAWSGLAAHTRTAGLSMLALFGASFQGTHGEPAVAFAVLHLAGVAVAALGLIVTIGRFFRHSLAEQVMAVAIVASLVLYLGSNFSSGILNGREIAVVLPFSAILAGRTIGPWLTRAAALPASPRPSWFRRSVASLLLLVLAGYAACLGYQVTQPTVPAAMTPLASWLSDHHLTRGLSGYWQSSSVTVDSRGKVTLRAITNHFSGVVPYQWESKASWYDWRTQYANFVVLQNQPGYFNNWTPTHEITDVFGRPAVTYHTGPYTIMVWDKNILVTLHQWEQAAS
jgi:hypothetical protein